MTIVIISVLALLTCICFYLVTRFHKFEFINNIKNVYLSWGIALFVVLLLISMSYVFGLIIVVYALHLALFFLLTDIIIFIIKKITKKAYKYYYFGFMVLLITSLYITYAWFNAKDIKETTYIIDSSKINREINIIQIADVHVGTTIDGKQFSEYLNKISKINPDVIVMTGDFVDESTSYNDMIISCDALGKTKTKYGIYIVFGNHDLNTYGGNKNYTSSQFITKLQENNVQILQDQSILINNDFYLIGRNDKTVVNRKNLATLTKELDKTKYMIVLDHQPVNFEENVTNGIDLMLSGHTHGGQMFPLAYIGELVSSNEMTYGLEKKENTTFIVSSGMSGWGIPLKTGTVSEYVSIVIN